MKPLKTRKVATQSFTKGRDWIVSFIPARNPAIPFRSRDPAEVIQVIPVVTARPGASRNRSRRKMAGRMPSPAATTATPSASPRAPSSWVSNQFWFVMIQRNQGETT